MAQDWKDPVIAKQWDTKGNAQNPTRTEQLDILLTIMEQRYRPEHMILDLGYGSGKVESLIFERIPVASIVGVDSSEAMMQLAAERLSEYQARFTSVKHDLSDIKSLALPEGSYQFAFAVQSLHHLAKDKMHAVYDYVYNVLEPGGMFLLIDRFQVESPEIWDVLHTVWMRQDYLYGSTVALHEGDSFEDHGEKTRDRGDYPVRLDEHLAWMKEIGFEAACIHLHGHRGMIVGCKR